MSGDWVPLEVSGTRRYLRDAAAQQRRIWQRAVFVDWHGVLCDEPFWNSITENPRHQHQRTFSKAITELFSERTGLIEAWMRGRTDAHRVVGQLPQLNDGRCGPDYLYRRLVRDCERMEPQGELLEALLLLPVLTLTVIATDNMDCFSDSVPRLSRVHGVFDAALCSSDLGVLKAEDPERFFGQLLNEYDLCPADAVLIDDSERNCNRFLGFGGHAIHYRDIKQAAAELEHWARRP